MPPNQPANFNTSQTYIPPAYTTGPDRSRRRSIILLILLVAAIFAFGLLFWLTNRAYLSITVEGAADGDITYTIINQGSGDRKEITTPETTVKTLLPTGDYEVLVQQAEAAGFVFAETKRFLGTTEATVSAAPERHRTFIGDGVGPCTAYDEILYSYSCGSTLPGLQAHQPATKDTPTTTQLAQNPNHESVIQGTLTYSGKPHLLLRYPTGSVDEGSGYRHVIKPLDKSLRLPISSEISLKGIDEEKYYSVAEFREGFLLYESAPTKAYYFKEAASEPEVIEILQPDDDEMEPYIVNVSQDRIVVGFQKHGEEDAIDHDDREAHGEPSVISVIDGDESNLYEFSQTYLTVLPCGSSKLCMNNGEILNVYDISGQHPELQFALTGIRDIKLFGDDVLAVKDDVVLHVNVDNKSGTVAYQLGEYQPCGIHTQNNSFIICAMTENNRFGLLVDMDKPITEPIDKQILRLADADNIKALTVYRNFIHISQELGEPTYDEELQIFNYSRQHIATRTKAIDDQISQIGINREKYEIIYAF